MTSIEEMLLRAANINPISGLATDFLNPFNEYLMLAEMVEQGLEQADCLSQWSPISYEDHFERVHFAGSDMVLLAYSMLRPEVRSGFDAAVGDLNRLIDVHKQAPSSAALSAAARQRDQVAALITPPHHSHEIENEAATSQADIDALFD